MEVKLSRQQLRRAAFQMGAEYAANKTKRILGDFEGTTGRHTERGSGVYAKTKGER